MYACARLNERARIVREHQRVFVFMYAHEHKTIGLRVLMHACVWVDRCKSMHIHLL